MRTSTGPGGGDTGGPCIEVRSRSQASGHPGVDRCVDTDDAHKWP